MAGYGMTDPAAVAAINAMAKKNVAATKPVAQTTYTPTELQDLRSGNFQSLFPGSSLIGSGDASKARMMQFGASYMPSVNPTAQTTGAGIGSAWMSGMPDWVRANYENMGVDTSSVPLWGGGTYVSRNSPSAASGGVPVGGFGGSSGGMGSMGGLGGLGGMGGMSGIGSALGGMLGGGGMGGGSYPSGSTQTAAEQVDQRPVKPNPQRMYAGGYTTQELADQMNAGDSAAGYSVKNLQDAKKNAYAFAHPTEDEGKKADLIAAQRHAQETGGLYDAEGGTYTREQADKLTKEESEKKKLAEASMYQGGPVTKDGGKTYQDFGASSSGGGSGSGSSGGGSGGGFGGGGGFDFGSMLGGLSSLGSLFGGMGGGGAGSLGSLGSAFGGGGFSMPSGFSSGALGGWNTGAASSGGSTKVATSPNKTAPKTSTVVAGSGYGQSSPTTAAAINGMAAKNNAVAGSGYGMTNLGAAQKINAMNSSTAGYGMNSPSAASNVINNLALQNKNATKIANEGKNVVKTNLSGLPSKLGLRGYYT